jgi:hypothetical protein
MGGGIAASYKGEPVAVCSKEPLWVGQGEISKAVFPDGNEKKGFRGRSLETLGFTGAPGTIRTCDLRIRSL